MTTPKHTPGPWGTFTHINNEYIDILGREGAFIARLEYCEDVENLEANAARIVACVNSMAGIENPEQWVKDQKRYREQMANSSLSAEIDLRIHLEQELEHEREQLTIFKSHFEELQAERDELQRKLDVCMDNNRENLDLSVQTIRELAESNLNLLKAIVQKSSDETKPREKTIVQVDPGKIR